jgi:hypothetical protein
LSVLLYLGAAPSMLTSRSLSLTLAVKPEGFQRWTLRRQHREGGFCFDYLATCLGKLETQLANFFERLLFGVDIALEGQQLCSSFAPVGLGPLRWRWVLGEDDRGRPALDNSSRVRVFDLANHGIALGGLQIEPEPAIVMPPEGLLEGRPVFRVTQYGGDQAPGLDRIGGDVNFVAVAVGSVVQSMGQIADRLEIAQFIRRPADRPYCRQLLADIFDGLVVAGGNQDLVTLEGWSQGVELKERLFAGRHLLTRRRESFLRILERCHCQRAVEHAGRHDIAKQGRLASSRGSVHGNDAFPVRKFRSGEVDGGLL